MCFCLNSPTRQLTELLGRVPVKTELAEFLTAVSAEVELLTGGWVVL